jgi:hypothetical protein
MRGWGMAVARRVVGVGRGRPMAGGSRPDGQPGAHTASIDRSEATCPTHPRTHPLVAATIVPPALVHNAFAGIPFSLTLARLAAQLNHAVSPTGRLPTTSRSQSPGSAASR